MDTDISSISMLASLLRENGDKVLNSESKLSLTVTLLESLNKTFGLYLEDRSSFNSSFEVTHVNNYNDKIVNNVQFLYDFVQRVESIKITQNSLQLNKPSRVVDINKFKNVKYLELKRVHIWDIIGIQNLRSQLQSIICTKCVKKISELLLSCGGDRCTESSWTHLCEAVFSYNSITSLDHSLNLAPLIQVLDISHNRITATDGLELLTNLKYLNIGYNSLETVPRFNEAVFQKLQVLILRNNFIENLSGLAQLESLVELDLSCNCITSHESLASLSNMAFLSWLSLEGNPLSFVLDHRMYTAMYLSENAMKNEFVLDRLLLAIPEKMVVGTIFKSRLPSAFVGKAEEWKPSTSSTTLAICEVHATEIDEERELPTTSHQSKKSTGVKKKGRVREAIILEKNDDTEEDSDFMNSSSLTNSFSMPEDHLETKKKVEMLRAKFGKDHWLHSQGGSCLRDVLGMQDPSIPIISTDILSVAHDMVLTDTSMDNASQGSSEDVTAKRSAVNGSTSNETPANVPVAESEVSVYMDCIDSAPDESQEANKHKEEYPTETELKCERFEEDNNMEEDEEEDNDDDPDDDDSQIYIVQRCYQNSDRDGNETFLIVTHSHIKERRMSDGKLQDKWSLDSLLSCGKICNDPITIQLTFDTVRRSRKERIYVTDELDSEKLLQTLVSLLESRTLTAMNQLAYRCMKCSTQFSQEANSKVLIEEPENEALRGTSSCIRCPTCGSVLVIQMDEEPLPSNTGVTDGALYPVEHDAEDALTTSLVKTETSSEVSITKSPSQSSIGGGSMVQVTALIHHPATACSQDIKALSHTTCSATSLDHSPKAMSMEAAPIKRWESDIEILSNPSQSSIEVLDDNGRVHGGTPARKRSSEERQTAVVSAASIPQAVSVMLGGLTESSSSGSLTDSVCTTYKTSADDASSTEGKKENHERIDTANSEVISEKNTNYTRVAEKRISSYNRDITEQRKGKLSESSDDTLEGADLSVEQDETGSKNSTLSYTAVLEGLLQSISSKMSLKESPSPSGEEIRYSYTDYSVVDHRVKLHLYMHVFEEEEEELLFLVRCQLIAHNAPTPFPGCVVFSTRRVYFLQVTGKEVDNPEQWLQKSASWPSDQMTEIQKLPWHQGVGLGVKSDNGRNIKLYYILLIQDYQRTLDFLTYASGLSLPDKCSLTIHSVQETHTLLIQQTVLSSGSPEEDCDVNLRQFVIFSHCLVQHCQGHKDLSLGVLVVTGSSLILTVDNLEWLFPENTGTLQIYRTQPLSNLIEVEENDNQELTLHFLDVTDTEESWVITMATRRMVDAVVDSIKPPWEQLFSVPLQIIKK